MAWLPFWAMPGSWGLRGKTREIAKAEYELEGEERDRKVVELKYEGDDRSERLLNIDLQYNHIGENEYDRNLASLHGEPWVAVKESKYNPVEGLSGFSMELDYNDEFVEFLREQGFDDGAADEQVVNAWFDELCRQIAEDDGFGTEITTMTIPSKSIARKDRKDGRIEYK